MNTNTMEEKTNGYIPLSRPDITEREINCVVEVLRTPHLSLGPKLYEFEAKFARYLGVKHAIAVSSGTAGLHLAIKSLRIGERDAVFTTPFSFISSANCMLFEGATPLFIDIEESTFNIDAAKIEEYIQLNCAKNSEGLIDRRTGRRVKAILPVHVFGQPCEMDKIMELAEKYNLHIIEDACESIGAEFNGNKVGTLGDLGVFAFYPNKQITTGEGGMIVTNDNDLAALCRSMRNQGRGSNSGWLAHCRLGYNYRISEILCAIGIVQLDRIDEILAKREQIAFRYNGQLKHWVKMAEIKPGTKKSWFAYVVRLPQQYNKKDRDHILAGLANKGIGCNNYFPPIHLQPFYTENFGYKKGDFPITERISERTIALPFHNNLKEREIIYVANSLIDALSKNHRSSFRRIDEFSFQTFENSLSPVQ